MSEQRPTTPDAARAAAYLATRERLDFRTGKTVISVKCNPPNVRCGNRCIPPNWDCRLKGQGNDPHLAAKRTDPVGGLANIERGIKRLGKFARTGSFSELESSKRSLVRGAVKLKPGTLKEKNEFKAWIEQNWGRVAIPITIAGVGLFAHAGLKSGNVFGYREGAGAKIDRAVHTGIGAVLDVVPGVGQARSYTRRRAAEATALNLERVTMRTQRNRALLNPEAGIPGTPIPSTWKTSGGSDLNSSLLNIDNAIKEVDSAARLRRSTFYEWNTRHNTAFWGATHPSSGRSVFAEPSAKAFLNDEWRLNLAANADASAYRVALANRIASDSDAFVQLAKQQGFRAYGTPGEQYLSKDDIDEFIVRNTKGMPREQASAHGAFLRTAVQRGSHKTKANVIYAGHVRFYDRYFKERVIPNLKDVAGAPAFDPDMQGAGAISLRATAQKRRTDFLIQTSNKPNKVSAGISHDELFMLDYYHTRVAGDQKSPYIISSRLAVTAASELSGKTKLTPTEAIELLNKNYGFSTAQLEQRRAVGRPVTTPTTESGRPARRRRQPRAQVIADLIKAGYSPEAAAVEADRLKALREGRTDGFDPDPNMLPPRVRAYLETQSRLDKRCGKSGIPEKMKCTKPTPAQSPEAAQRAKGAAQPGVTCAPGTEACGKICIPQGSTCHLKGGSNVNSNIAKGALAVGAVAGGILAAKKGKQVFQNRRNIEAYTRLAPKTMNDAITRLSQKDIRRALNSVPKQFRPQAEKLVGKAKAAMAYISADARGFNLRKVNNDSNFSVWSRDDGSKVLSVGSVGDTLVTFSADRTDTVDLRTEGGRGAGVYDIQFNSDLGFQQKTGLTKESQTGITSMIKSMNKDTLAAMPKNAVLRNIPYGDDGLGRKRQAIYKRFGYKSLPGLRGNAMFATLSNGKVVPIEEKYEEFYSDLIKGESYQSASDKLKARLRRDASDRNDFTPGPRREGKPCGKSFIKKTQKCSKTTTAKYATESKEKEKESSAQTNSNIGRNTAIAGGVVAAAGAATILLALGKKRGQIDQYRRNVSKSALEAEKLASEMERSMREKAAQRLGKRVENVTGYEASVYNYKDKGFDRGFGAFESDPTWFGQTKNSKGAVVMLSYADERGKGGFNMAQGGAFQQVWGDRDILPYANNISQPKSGAGLDDLQMQGRRELLARVQKMGGKTSADIVKNVFTVKDSMERFTFLGKNIDSRGFNPDAVRAAAFVAAQRRLTGKPVDIMAYSNGGNVATETLAILSEMGYRDVKVVNIAGPTFGMFEHPPANFRTWVSEGDEFYKASNGYAFQNNVTLLKNKNIPHGLQDGIDRNNRENGANWRENIKAKNSYLLDEQLQREAYTFLTVDKKRSAELVNESIWRFSENATLSATKVAGRGASGDLGALFGDSADATGRRWAKALDSADPAQRERVKQMMQGEIEDRMLEVWYGGYNPKSVKNAQNQIRAELASQVEAPKRARPNQRPVAPTSINTRITQLMKQNPGMTREAARNKILQDRKRSDAYTNTYTMTLTSLQMATTLCS